MADQPNLSIAEQREILEYRADNARIYLNRAAPALDKAALLYSIEEWKSILRAHIRQDHDDALYLKCRFKVREIEREFELVDEVWFTLVCVGLHAIGLVEFQQVMLDFVPIWTAFLDSKVGDADYPHDLAKARETIARFVAWCNGEIDADDAAGIGSGLCAQDFIVNNAREVEDADEELVFECPIGAFYYAVDAHFFNERLRREALDQRIRDDQRY